MAETKSKTVKIGSIWLNSVETKDGRQDVPSIKLGTPLKKSSPSYKPEYDISVELVAKDGNGKVVAHLTGDQAKAVFISMYTPSATAPQNLKYDLVVPRKA